MASGEKYIYDLNITSDQLGDDDKIIIEKANGSGTTIMTYQNFVNSVLATMAEKNSLLLFNGMNGVTEVGSSDDLDTVYTGQPDNSVIFIKGQNEANQPRTAGAIHLVVSHKRNNNYGIQIAFYGSTAYSRTNNQGWTTWKQFTLT